MSEKATIQLNGEQVELPVITGTQDEKALDISKLRGSTGYITLDLGFKNTGSTQSAITFLDGERGILRYRGYSIEDLAGQSNFLEVAFLLVFGELPTKSEYEQFAEEITNHTLVHEDIKKFMDAYPTTATRWGS